MKILELEVDGFGVWTGLRLGDLGGQFSVFLGPNEAGKTTLMQFVRAILYGFSDDRRRRYLPPLGGGLPGGTLSVSGPSGRFRVSRHLDAAARHVTLGDSISGDSISGEGISGDGISGDGGMGEARITAADGTLESGRILPGLLGNVSEATFNNVFAVGLREIQELGSLSDTAAADLLYHVSTGLGRVSLGVVLRELATSRERLLSTDDRPCQLETLLAQRDKFQREIEELRGVSQRYSLLAHECERLAADVAVGEAEAVEMAHSLRALEAAVAAREPWQARAAIDAELAALAELPPDAKGALAQLEAAVVRVEQRRRKLTELKQQRTALRDEIAGLGLNHGLVRHAPKIEALAEQESWLGTLENQVHELEAGVHALSTELTSERERFGWTSNRSPATLPKLDERTLAALRPAARALREPRLRRHEAQRQLDKARRQVDRLAGEIRSRLTGREHEALAPALEETGNLVAQLRRRVQLDERISQLGRNEAELNEQSRDLLDDQLLPGWVLSGLGSAFVVGVVLLMTRIYLPAFLGTAGWWLSALGLLGMVAAGGVKYLLEHAATTQLEACQKRSATLAKQWEQAKQEREALDAQLPRGGGPLLTRLQTAEKDLTSLEELLAVDARRQAAQQEADAAQARATQARDDGRGARRRWQQALASAGLPNTLSPRQVRQYADGSQQVDELERRLKGRRQEFEARRHELDSLVGRIQQVIGDADLKPSSPLAIDRLRMLRHALAEHQALSARRQSLEARLARIRRQQTRLIHGIRRWRQRREQWLRLAGVADESELRRRAAEHGRRETLRQRRASLTREIAAALGRRCDEDQVRCWLDGRHVCDLDARWEELAGRSQAAQRELQALFEQRGRAQQELTTLADDRRLAERMLDLGVVETRLREAAERWRTLAVTSCLIDGVRKKYETDRQPETLQEASKYLSRLTGGHYQRIWTPLGEQALRVDDCDGHSLPVEVLSRGTREQLFLSLRLALVALYARRGVELPLILDDVLVNFDARRAKAAAAVLRDFAAAGHQTLVFTCHEHVGRLFKQLKVPTRQLPANAEHEMVSVAYQAPAALPPIALPPIALPPIVLPPVAAPVPLATQPVEPPGPAAQRRAHEASDDLIWVDHDDAEEQADRDPGDRTSHGADRDDDAQDRAGRRSPQRAPGEPVHRVTVVRARRTSGPFDDTFWHEPVEDDLDDELAGERDDDGQDFDDEDADIDTEGEEHIFAERDDRWHDTPFDSDDVEEDEAA
ncbi:MAG TPA: AAA family ATPase [Pirellulales bacterium]|nr:AAA family ATPase [Pirellulales bacterium]